MDTNSVFGEVLEKAGTAAKQTGKAAASAVSDTAHATVSQITGSDVGGLTPSRDVEKSQPQNTNPQTPLNQPAQIPTGSGNTQEQLNRTRTELSAAYQKQHTETYYDPTFNRPKQEEESVSEKLEKEDKQEMAQLQQKEMEKPPPLAQQRAAQRVEKFPGASG